MEGHTAAMERGLEKKSVQHIIGKGGEEAIVKCRVGRLTAVLMMGTSGKWLSG